MTEEENKYFSIEEEQKIVESIRDAENMTSGEIRVHISKKPDDDALETAKRIFKKLQMYKTKYRNGVLLHISMGSKTFSIYGDKGINDVVPINFWESTRDIIQQHFKNGEIAQGICAGIHNVGKVMKEYFPLDIDDKNELSDEISYD